MKRLEAVRESSRTLLFRLVRAALRMLAKSYFRLQVEGLHLVPRSGPAVIAANHPSLLDGMLLFALCPRPVRFLVTEEMYYHPLLRGFFWMFSCIPVYRTKDHNDHALRAALEALRSGDIVGIFPEGTTARRGDLSSIRSGVAVLALRTGAPVVPLAFQGTAEAFPRDARLPRPRAIAMRFGAPAQFSPVPADHVPDECLVTVRQRILRRLRATLDRTVVRAQSHCSAGLRLVPVMFAACVLLPLSALLTATARPSLDPARTKA